VQALALVHRIEADILSSDDLLAGLYADLLDSWWNRLLPLFRAENECLLARLIRVVPPEHQAVVRAQTEHLYLEALVATMRDTREVVTRRDAIRRFGETLGRHLRWEQEVLFELAETELSDGDLDMVARDLVAYLPDSEVRPQS
jgi:hypothetical protein